MLPELQRWLWQEDKRLEADLPAGPPDPLFYEELDFGGVYGQSEDQHAGRHGPVVVSDPPGSNAAAIHLHQARASGPSETCPAPASAAQELSVLQRKAVLSLLAQNVTQ